MANLIPDEGSEPVIVTVNEKEYVTHLYRGIRRFVPNKAVSFIAERAGYATNDLRLAVLEGKVPLADLIEFETMVGWSLGGFEDSLTSLIQLNPHVFPGKTKKHFRFEIPGY